MQDVFEWKDDFLTGYEDIDNDHQTIFKEMNELYHYLEDTKKYSEMIIPKIQSLHSLMVSHLEEESRLLEYYKFSGYMEHIEEHINFENNLINIQKNELPKTLTAVMLLDAVIDYFLNHFSKYDKVFINQIKDASEQQ
jgi:hemerythrin-like metal-binding protein